MTERARPNTAREVAGAILREISSRHLTAGDPLPSIRELSALHGAATNTVGKALAILAEDGHITLRPHAPAVVSTTPALPIKDLVALRSDVTDLHTRVNELAAELAAVGSQLDATIARVDPYGTESPKAANTRTPTHRGTQQ